MVPQAQLLTKKQSKPKLQTSTAQLTTVNKQTGTITRERSKEIFESKSISPSAHDVKNRSIESGTSMEPESIAQRIVQPVTVHRVRQMIDNLCQKEKSFIYQNPNVREDCVGTQDTIFNLSNSHIVNRPGMLAQLERLAKKNLEEMD